MTEQGRRPTREGVIRAAAKVAEAVPLSPLLPLELGGTTIWCKAEGLQPIGAFKLRGAWHRLTDLSEDERAKGVVAFSSGNHAQGVAWAARRLGMAATIVMPRDAPDSKIAGTLELGAEIFFYDRLLEDRAALAAALAAERGAALVPSFDDPWVIEGQGSAGIELAAQLGATPDRIVIPCGGGGLAAGIALACPEAEIVVVEPEGWDDMTRSLDAGRILPVGANPPRTGCDALQTLEVSPLTFDVLSARGARGVAVSEEETEVAMRFAFDRLRLVLEYGGAVALAAILQGKVAADGVTVVLLSGGNVDAARFAEVLSR